MLSVLVHTILFGVWTVWNLGMLNLKPFDPSFIILATFAGVEAIFLTTFVLIGQKHMNAQAEKWAELDLQVSLPWRTRTYRVLTLVTKIARAVNVDVDEDRRSRNCQKIFIPIMCSTRLKKLRSNWR